MIHRGIRLAYTVVMLASAAIAFVVVRNFDETATRGPSYTVSFNKSESGAGAADVTRTVDRFAQSHGVNIGRLYYDQLNLDKLRIYLAVGDPNADSTHWLKDGYPYFSRNNKIEIHNYDEISNIDPSGMYLIYGTQADATDLLQKFRQLGYNPSLEAAFSLARAPLFLGNGGLLSSFLVVGLIAIVLVSSAVALNAQSYGVRRLHGQSFTRILQQDLVQLARFCAIYVTGIAIGTSGFLYWYNKLHQIDTYALIAFALFGVYVGAALAAHVVTLAVLHQGMILEAVKGEVTARWAIVGSYILRCWGILLILSISTAAITSGVALAQHRSTLQTWTSIGSAYYMRISGAIDESETGHETGIRIGRWIRDADERGEVSLASNQTMSGPASDVLVVNDRYLKTQKVYGSDGLRIQPQPQGEIRIMVPQKYAMQSAEIRDEVLHWATSQNEAATHIQPNDMHLERIRDDQTLTIYAHSFEVRDITVKDAVVVVVPGTSALISDDEYVSMASRGEVLVENPDTAMKSLASAGLADYILGMSPFAQEAADGYRDAEREFSTDVTNLFIGIAVLLITGVTVSSVYCRRNAQTLFTKYIHGWGFLQTHWRLLAIESTFGLVMVLWVWHQTAAALERRSMPGAPPPLPDEIGLGSWEPVVAAVVAVTSFALITLALMRTTARFVRTHSSTLS